MMQVGHESIAEKVVNRLDVSQPLSQPSQCLFNGSKCKLTMEQARRPRMGSTTGVTGCLIIQQLTPSLKFGVAPFRRGTSQPPRGRMIPCAPSITEGQRFILTAADTGSGWNLSSPQCSLPAPPSTDSKNALLNVMAFPTTK